MVLGTGVNILYHPISDIKLYMVVEIHIEIVVEGSYEVAWSTGTS